MIDLIREFVSASAAVPSSLLFYFTLSYSFRWFMRATRYDPRSIDGHYVEGELESNFLDDENYQNFRED
ncbi:hypothetical protein [Gimesia aquarii]|uniref:Uncharacterized protein n=1 Tax=Gimesia aquarii TaxID=2527964 RepID=A0A517WW28_9PLAN|nr:hypothetical protein [Gimesia aquarii]QDU09471.1 hypothetical protein V202x_28460 [Gimesia aquarii]